MLSHHEIYKLARQDLSIYALLDIASRQHSGVANEIYQQDIERIFPVILAYYNAWFFQLSSRLVKDSEIEPEKIQKYFKGFQNISSFPEEINLFIKNEIEYICAEHGTSFPSGFAKKLNADIVDTKENFDDEPLEFQKSNIQQYIEKSMENAKSFLDIDNTIRNGASASSRIFPKINTAIFNNAYGIYKKNFLDYIIAQSLVLSLSKKDFGQAKTLLKQLSDPIILLNPLEGGEWTLFHKICQDGSADLLTDVFEKLDRDLMKIVALITPQNWNPKCLNEKLFASAKIGNNEIVGLSLQLGAQINARTTGSGKTSISMASEGGHLKTVNLLLEEGASVEKGEAMWSALHLAVKREIENTELVEILIKNGADTNEEDINKFTPLHLAVKAGNSETVRMLLKYGSDPYIMDSKGNTPLHLAAESGNEVICKLLIYSSASLGIKNHDNKTPLEVASAKNHVVLAEQMKKWRKSSKEKGYTLDIDQMQKRLKFQDGVLMEQSKLIEALRQENALLKQQSSLQRRQSSIFQLAQDKKPILEIKEKKERKESMHIEIKNPSCDNKPQMMFFSRSRDNANKEKMQNIQHSPNNLSTADKLTNKL